MVTGLSSAGGNGVQQGGPNKVMIVGNTISPNSVNSDVQKRAANDHRRSNKPIMEKRRRARINNCLNELKTLILDAMKKDPARHSKLEKADILEMTVKHLESLQRQRTASEPSVADKFRAGFRECASEVGRFPGIEPAAKRRLLQHLATCLPAAPALPEGLQLVPARLPNGDVALVLPALVPVPARTASTASASSGSTPPPCYSPVSPPDWSAASSRAGASPCSSPASSPEPLELVVRAHKPFRLPVDDDKPWRPW